MILASCSGSIQQELQPGIYRATMEVRDGKSLPFNFEIEEDGSMQIFNGEEVISAEAISYPKDSIKITFPVYEGYIAGHFKNGTTSELKFIKESLDRVVPMSISYGEEDRFKNVAESSIDISGEWEMLFTEEDSSTFIAKGIFKQDENIVTGTIRTTTGDHRFLEGVLSGNELKLSVFDGAHAFLYTADVAQDKMENGAFYYGNHYKSTFIAKRNPNYELPHVDSLTFLNEGYDQFDFSFPDLDGNLISLKDEMFQDKVVVAQIMGSWCPNCIDESQYYTEYLSQNDDPSVQFVALAFEYASTEEKAIAGLKRLKSTLEIGYPILLAQYGSSDKGLAQQKLPMLNHVLSYPTTIFIDKKGQVRKIHTGYNGPATGEKFVEFKKEFTGFLEMLSNES